MGLMSYIAKAQDGISASVLHDTKLLFMGDDKGNPAGTTDVILNVNLEGKQFAWYYFGLQAQYEHANLKGGYLRRYSVHGMWYFNRLVVPNLTIGVGVGPAVLHRPGMGKYSYSFTSDVSYKLTKNLDFIIKNEWVRRTDLEVNATRYNLSAGLKYKFLNL